MSLLVMVDSLIVLVSLLVSYLILHPTLNLFSNKVLLITVVSILAAHHFYAWRYGLYRKAWSFASIGELKSIFKAVTMTIAVVMVVQIISTSAMNLRLFVLVWMLHILLIGSSRLSLRLIFEKSTLHKGNATIRTAIIGAGEAGRMVARQVLQNPETGMKPVLFIDDDSSKNGLEIYGLKVAKGTDEIEELIKSHHIEKIIIAIPSLSRQEMARVSRLCAKTGVKTQAIPRIEDLLTGKISVNEMNDINIEELLGREEVQLDINAIGEKLTNKTILVTGAGGSIGSEICRQVCEFKPKRLILLGHGENSIYTIDMELRKIVQPQTELIPVIADVKDRIKISEIVCEYLPDVIYHAAAHKHVPLMEKNPMEAVKNNIFGTKNIAEAADTFGVAHFVLVSSDKAVNPPNIMGATKRFAEMIIQNLAKESATKFAAVRFGNVLGSRGSVLPLFTEQIKKGGPVTVTDPQMTRYFMTISEASRLVIQVSAIAGGGEVFVLDMGEPVKIVDLAKKLIKMSGYEEEEIGIEFSGIRPGEKLFEELLGEDEVQSEQIFPKIYVGKATPISKRKMDAVLEKLLDMTDKEMKETIIGLANQKELVWEKVVTTA